MALWTPADYAGGVLTTWHDPSNASNVTVSSGKVSQDNDLSGSGYNDVQATGAAQPAYVTGALNGLAVEDFTGANLNFTTSYPCNPAAQTYMALAYYVDGGGAQTLWGSSGSAGQQFRVYLQKPEFVAERVVLIGTGTVNVPNNSWAIIVGSYVQSTGAYVFRVNGDAAGSGSYAYSLASGTSLIGLSGFIEEAWNEKIAERATLSTVTQANMELFEGYVAWKYGLQTGAGGILPSGHPYYSAAPTTGAPSPSVGSAAGTSTASGVGKSLFTGAGSSAGTSTASAVGKSLFTGAGTSAGTSTALADGQSLFTGTGSAAGTSTALGTSQSLFRVTGSASGTSTALGVSVAVAPIPAFQSDVFQTNAFQAQYVISLSLSASVTLSDSLYSQRTVNIDLTDDVTLSDTVSSITRPRKIGMVWAYQWIVLTVDRADN